MSYGLGTGARGQYFGPEQCRFFRFAAEQAGDGSDADIVPVPGISAAGTEFSAETSFRNASDNRFKKINFDFSVI